MYLIYQTVTRFIGNNNDTHNLLGYVETEEMAIEQVEKYNRSVEEKNNKSTAGHWSHFYEKVERLG